MREHELPDLSLEEMHRRAVGFFLMDSAAFFLYLERKGIDPKDFFNFELNSWPQRRYDSPVQFLLHVMAAYYALGTPRENFRILETADHEARGWIKDCAVKAVLDAKPTLSGQTREFASAAQILGEAKIDFSSEPFCRNLCISFMSGEAERTGMECLVSKGYGSDPCQFRVKRKSP